MPIPSSRTIEFQMAREALRHRLAICTSGWAASGLPSLRAEIVDLCAQLRDLGSLDRAALADLHRRHGESLAARPLHADPAHHPAQAHAAMLPAQESARIFEDLIWPALYAGHAAPQARPRAIVYGAHVGCSKARGMAQAARALGGPGQVVTVMLEDLRPFHPGYARLLQHNPRLAAQYTEPDVLRWLDMAVSAAMAARAPLVLEAGMRKARKIVVTFESLEAAGYEVEARALAVPHAISWQNIVVGQELSRRQLGLTRTTSAAAHQATYDGLAGMLEHIEQQQLASQVSVYDRFGECCYSHDVRTGRKFGSSPTAVTELRIRRALPMTLQHLRQFHQAYVWLEASVADPERQTGNEEWLQTEGLRWEAQCALLAEAFLTLPEPDCLAEFPQLEPAFSILDGIRQQATEIANERHRTLLVKKAAEVIGRRISDGNFAAPYPW